jgi:hypothetical protein
MAAPPNAGVRANDTSSKSGRDPGAFLRYFKTADELARHREKKRGVKAGATGPRSRDPETRFDSGVPHFLATR